VFYYHRRIFLTLRTDTSICPQQVPKPASSSRFTRSATLSAPFSADRSPIGGDGDGECLSAHRLLSAEPACKRRPRTRRCSSVVASSSDSEVCCVALLTFFPHESDPVVIVATCATAGPSYVAEMAHPAWRGTLTGLYNTFWYVGGIPATWTVYGTQSIPNDLSWRLPIWLQAVASGLVLCGCLFCPETPRWVGHSNRKASSARKLTAAALVGFERPP
jgi:hypothetical protein